MLKHSLFAGLVLLGLTSLPVFAQVITVDRSQACPPGTHYVGINVDGSKICQKD